MRAFSEPTRRNLLRPTHVFGVSFSGLLLLTSLVMAIQIVGQGTYIGNISSLAFGILGFGVLRLAARFGKIGWDESLLFIIEWCFLRKTPYCYLTLKPSPIEVTPPDTLDETDLIRLKERLADNLKRLRPNERLSLVTRIDSNGVEIKEIDPPLTAIAPRNTPPIHQLTQGIVNESAHVYSLAALPYSTTPLFLFHLLEQLGSPALVVSTFIGVDQYRIKARIESSRKRSGRSSSTVTSDIDSDVTFAEATKVAQELSSGTENMVLGGLLLVSKDPLGLDPELFVEEKRKFTKKLALFSALGFRRKPHRSSIMRVVTATDLVPNIGDPFCPQKRALIKTPRSRPLCLDFQDPAFSALHMNVNGTSGAGKSVFVMALLHRMVAAGVPLSVLFVDHLRSFRRFVRTQGGVYLEPRSSDELSVELPSVLASLNRSGIFAGVELSELFQEEKKKALKLLLTQVEGFLKKRATHHPIYLVMDECWNILRDEPVLVQRAFREFRKLDGAAVAITQSLSDLLTHENGQAIFQNSSIQIVLRQREDPAKYAGDLGLNHTEIDRVRSLKQEKGVYSECLIKTPFFSRIGRLELSPEEHDLYRTDTIRREVVRELLQKGAECHG